MYMCVCICLGVKRIFKHLSYLNRYFVINITVSFLRILFLLFISSFLYFSYIYIYIYIYIRVRVCVCMYVSVYIILFALFSIFLFIWMHDVSS